MSHSHSDRPDVPRNPFVVPSRRLGFHRRTARELPRFRVVLHRDDNDLMFVIRSIMELIRFPRAEATQKMWESVHLGSSILLTTYFERAELYVVQFAEKGLKVTAEPA